MLNIPQRLASMRELMTQRGLAAYIVLSSDPHLSEYLPDYWQERLWLSGFSGSAGTLIVAPTEAGLWTDGRYWEQAQTQLKDTGIVLKKVGSCALNQYADWLIKYIPAAGKIGVNGQTLSLENYRKLKEKLNAAHLQLCIKEDLLKEIWLERPPLPQNLVYEHCLAEAHITRVEKIARLRAAMLEEKADVHLLSSLDDIAWLLNLRGSDVDYNPVFMAYVLGDTESIQLFVDPQKIMPALRDKLVLEGIRLMPYSDIAGVLAGLTASQRLLIDPARVTCGLLADLPAEITLVKSINPTTLLKSRKSNEELEHVRAVMEQDGAALCEFFAWFEDHIGKTRITELTVDEKLTAARANRIGFVSLSFNTIAGFNANGALPHYQATPTSHATIEGQGLLLIDSGGQYLGGTTDITRVIAVGTPTLEQKRDFTLVLKGMIALSRARFPRGILAPMLDVLARAPIWASAVEYSHGTGHGVGYFLNVHEGPQTISYRASPNQHMAMEPGMITSNEPGIYRPGQWGVRIENLVCNRSWQTTESGEFLEFETLTLCPIDRRCINVSLLQKDDIQWLDAYHHQVRQRLLPHVSGPAADWLMQNTQPLSEK